MWGCKVPSVTCPRSQYSQFCQNGEVEEDRYAIWECIKCAAFLTCPTDFDPEALLDPAQSSGSDDRSDASFSDDESDNAGREHYTAVGKSKLRKKEHVPLGPAYAGRGISRQELEDSDSDNPFAERFVGEEDSDDEEDEEHQDGGEEKDLGVNGVKLEGRNEDDEQSIDGESEVDTGDEDDQDGSQTDDVSDENADSDDEDADSDNDEPLANGKAKTTPKSSTLAIRELMKATASSSATIAASAQSDADKGHAVKKQRKAFDSLLNIRIRLQKALISTNSMAAEPHTTEKAPDAAVEAAEAAAMTLLNNLTDLRHSLEEARTGQKRKRPHFDSNTSVSEILANMQKLESPAIAHRKQILERWSRKTKATTVANNNARLNAAATQTLTEVLDAQLTSSHLVTRTQTPRSCAPIQSSSKSAQPDSAIYDDADFYGLLLKELLEQRSAEVNGNGAAEFIVQAPWQLAREAKTKKVVDTKASKGRKLRYTVQEKLQNFMAPEERGTWPAQQRDEFFSSLFGQRLELGEQEDEEESEKDEDDEMADGGSWFLKT